MSFALCLGACSSDPSPDAVPDEHEATWVDRVSGENPSATQQGDAVALDSTGAALVGGLIDSDHWIRKYDSTGAPVWTDSGLQVSVNALAVDSDDSVIAVGFDLRESRFAAWVRKYGPDGDILWTSDIDGTERDTNGMCVGPSDEIFVVGSAYSGRIGTEIVTAKLDPEGELLWQVRQGGDDPDRTHEGWDVACDPDGSVYVLGSIDDRGDVAWLAKYGGDGDMLWARELADGEEALGRGLVVDPLGGIAVGISRTDGHSSITRLDTSGEVTDDVPVEFDALMAVDEEGYLLQRNTAVSIEDEEGCTADFPCLQTYMGAAKVDREGTLLWWRGEAASMREEWLQLSDLAARDGHLVSTGRDTGEGELWIRYE